MHTKYFLIYCQIFNVWSLPLFICLSVCFFTYLLSCFPIFNYYPSMSRVVLVNEKHTGGKMKKTNINSQEMLIIQRLNFFLPILYKIRNGKGVRWSTKPSSVVTKSIKKKRKGCGSWLKELDKNFKSGFNLIKYHPYGFILIFSYQNCWKFKTF